MITEFNIYIALFLGFVLLTFSIRLGISLYQSN
uniref:Photosystem I subunit XII n=1 Tax=Synura uvella TaxID=52557 RepID=A0A3G2QZL4_9STRA|nr:photosystem I subunit XII [Synura uvella]YP_009545320.1 photosystem I subunit XII [Synura uvella]AYO28439.1 photosystem I subunit XII [Synura uvella]AYO28474.1 photosystem I subunit XII [Synura uvella]